jgi:hypothetical protein
VVDETRTMVGVTPEEALASTAVSELPSFSRSETVMINRLVGGNAESRELVLKKLEDWLTVLAERFPDPKGKLRTYFILC